MFLITEHAHQVLSESARRNGLSSPLYVARSILELVTRKREDLAAAVTASVRASAPMASMFSAELGARM
jgi:hypothetical protein